MDREREIKEETRRPEPEDLGMPAAKENRILMALFPGEGRTYRGGIQELTEVYVSPTSDAYTGANGSQTITFIITSTDTEMIIPSLCPVSYTHLTLPTTLHECRSRWSPYH